MKEVISMTDPRTAALEALRDGLIRTEVRAGHERQALERAAVDAVRKMGVSVDTVSAATGLTPAEITGLLDRLPTVDLELDEVLGVAC
jgi:hypothetical protein